MTLIEQLTQEVGRLPAEKQREVLDFVEFLQAKQHLGAPRRDLYGLLKDYDFDLTLEEFQTLRREMTRNFPREFPNV